MVRSASPLYMLIIRLRKLRQLRQGARNGVRGLRAADTAETPSGDHGPTQFNALRAPDAKAESACTVCRFGPVADRDPTG